MSAERSLRALGVAALALFAAAAYTPLPNALHRRLAHVQRAAEVHGDVAGLRRNPRDAMLLPDIGQDLATHELQLVEALDRHAVVTDGHASRFFQRLRIEESQR